MNESESMKLVFRLKQKTNQIYDSCLLEEIRISKKLVKKLKEENWKEIEKELLEKRLEWFRKNIKHLSLKGDNLEKAYQLILLKIGIKPEEAPIIKKTKRKLVFHSKNF
jgi:hypothetical protein